MEQQPAQARSLYLLKACLYHPHNKCYAAHPTAITYRQRSPFPVTAPSGYDLMWPNDWCFLCLASIIPQMRSSAVNSNLGVKGIGQQMDHRDQPLAGQMQSTRETVGCICQNSGAVCGKPHDPPAGWVCCTTAGARSTTEQRLRIRRKDALDCMIPCRCCRWRLTVGIIKWRRGCPWPDMPCRCQLPTGIQGTDPPGTARYPACHCIRYGKAEMQDDATF
ncbi:hypothetical protein BT67DRAFT_122126 [Trichocladium antarcticum]|uniref:Uncharacterized protein n=1 Tax=Trichocladium antarcticum TaxID=1450529 RepID=A0AAN6URU2_9PEZI|nr:hypothetical protein BT67DRAFT_122126 [Trichocladium antarcticum]